jgi:hypothetical protein
MENNLLKNYIKQIILNESYSNSQKADAIFGASNSETNSAKHVYYQLLNLDNFFNNFCKRYKSPEDVKNKPMPHDILKTIKYVFALDYPETTEEEVYQSIFNKLCGKKTEYFKLTNIYQRYIKSNNSNVSTIAHGASRSVLNIGNGFVLKIMDTYPELQGVIHNQNKIESNPELQKILSPFVPLVYIQNTKIPKNVYINDTDRDACFWMISEKCVPLSQMETTPSQVQWLRKAGVSNTHIMDAIDDYKKVSKYPKTSIVRSWINSLLNDEQHIYIALDNMDGKEKMPKRRDYSQIELKIIEAHKKGLFEAKDIVPANLGYSESDGRPVILDTGYLRIE